MGAEDLSATVESPASPAVRTATGLLDARVQLVPLKYVSDRLRQELNHRAELDDHAVIEATHVMLRGTTPVGYLSLGGILTVFSWFDTLNVGASDSVRMIEQGEVLLRNMGLKEYLVAVWEKSPFAGKMEKMGFEHAMDVQLWHRKL